MQTEASPTVRPSRPVGRAGAVWLLSACLAVAGVAAYVFGVLPLTRLAAPVEIPWWLLAVGIFASESFVVHILVRDEAASLSLSELPVVLGLFFTNPALIVPAHLLGSALALVIVRRQGPKKLAFNISLVALQSSVAVIVFYALISLGSPLGWAGWLAAMVAVLAQDLLSDAAVTAAIALMVGKLEVDWNLVRFSFLVYLVNITLGIVGSLVVWTQPGAAWTIVVLGAIPFVAYRSYAALNAEHVRLGLLYRSTRSLLDPKNLETGVERLLETLQEMFNAERAELVTSGPGGRGAVTSRLGAEGTLERTPARDLEPGDRLWRRVLANGEAVLVTPPIEDPDLRDHLESVGIRDAMLAPVFGRGTQDVIGAVAVLNSRGDVGRFGAHGLQLLETVAHQVGVSLENSRLIDELRTEAEVRKFQALHDPLTDLPNRRALLERLAELLRPEGEERIGTLVLLNLDGFQHVNDTLGHEVGDAMLREVADRLRSVAGDREFVARIGGDEFVVLRPGEAPEAFANKLLAAVGAPLRLEGIPIEVTASAGRVRWPQDGSDGLTLLRLADVAMRLAKSTRSGVEDYRPERNGFSPERLALIGEFRGAMTEGQLFLVYQPKVSLTTGAVTGVEALIRWQHPTRGLVPPNEFIPHIEHTALIKPMTEWVIEQAVRQLASWREAGYGFSVSVNVPPRHVDAGTTLGGLEAFLRSWGIPADRLVLEITESGIMADPRGAEQVLGTLREAGVGISIDDFGTGLSSLSRLKDLPVSELKIDRSFVMQITEDPNADSIVRLTIELGHRLGLHVVAEGVETAEQLERLRELGCDTVQGFLLSRPQPPAELEAWMESQALVEALPGAG